MITRSATARTFCGPVTLTRPRVCGPALLPFDATRAGGSIDLASLLVELRDEFDLRDHPDYRHDWELLDRSSRELMADIRGEISDLAPLPRSEARAKVLDCLNRDLACFLVGESGSGKSALAKQIGEADYDRCLWFSESAVDHDTESAFEREIGPVSYTHLRAHETGRNLV